MGCVASRLEEEEEVVSICRERKRSLKQAVERRYALSDAHFRYCQSLFGVSAAIKLFVNRHSSPSQSSFLITCPSPQSPPLNKDQNNVVSNPLFLQQTPSEPTTQTASKCVSNPPSSSSSEESSSEEPEVVDITSNKHRHRHNHHYQQHHLPKEQELVAEEEKEQACGYFYMQHMPPPMPSPQRDFGWDFFNPFDGVRTEVMNGYNSYNNRSLDEDFRLVREEEGIPELEEEGERVEEAKEGVVIGESEVLGNAESGVEVVSEMEGLSLKEGEQKGLTVIDTPVGGRELLEALRDIEDHFLRAFESGKGLSKMLETNRVHLQSGLEEMIEKKTKLVQAITLRSSSCKSLVASSSKNSTAWTSFDNDLFDDYGGMDSGSHSLTLGRLYAWEKKLYQEVKDGDSIRRIYERKCNQLKNQDVRGEDGVAVDKTRAAVKDLYSRILVAIRSAESISLQIEKLRDEELQPQIIELIQGMMRNWTVMLESHEIQNKIISEVKLYTCPTYGKFCNNTHRLATLQLEAELHNWRACFIDYISALKSYIGSLHTWLSKFITPEVEFYSKGRRSPATMVRANGPPLLMICHDWLTSIGNLPDKMVTISMTSFGKNIRALWKQQGLEQQQKRKVDDLSKELEKKIVGFQKEENKMLETKQLLLEHHHSESEMENGDEFTKQNKELLDGFKRKLDFEKEKHHSYMQQTQKITLHGFQTGFSGVFESLAEFSKASLKMYNELLSYNEKVQKIEKPGYIEGSHEAEDGNSSN